MQNNTFPQLFTIIFATICKKTRGRTNPLDSLVQSMRFLRSNDQSAGRCRFPVFPFRQPVCRSENFYHIYIILIILIYYIIKINQNATEIPNPEQHDETAKRHNGKTHAELCFL